MRYRRTLVVGLALAAVCSGALIGASQGTAPKTTGAARGNVPGEWRYWGADAWSSRYSSLDQIDASNFNALAVSWTFNAGDIGGEPNEYYRTTPLYANGRLFTVATLKRTALALDPATGATLWKWDMDEGIR
jgi:glucose dehydrogenase